MGESAAFRNLAFLQLVAGGSAGFVEVCILHPLDVIKTRMQLQSSKPAVLLPNETRMYYNGISDCFKKMYRFEGMFSFYKGVLPPIIAETPKRAVKFFAFENCKKLFTFATPTSMVVPLSGACAGIVEAIVVNPFEVVKVSLQSLKTNSKEQPSTWAMTKLIIKTGGFGLKGLNKGITGTIARNGTFNMIFFGFYHAVKDFTCEFEDDLREFFRKIIIGFASGTLASCVNIPFDVAKSRIQAPQLTTGHIKYRKLFPTMKVIYMEEGWRALYKGLMPKVMRLGPGGAIMLVVYDYTLNFLLMKFPTSSLIDTE